MNWPVLCGPWALGIVDARFISMIFRTESPIGAKERMWTVKGPPGGIFLRRMEAEVHARHPHSISLQLKKLIACSLCHLSSACELQSGRGGLQAAWSRVQPRWSLAAPLTPVVTHRSISLWH